MAGLDLSAASNVLKNFYLGPIREQLNNSSILLARLDRDESTQDAYGKNFTVPLHTGRNGAAGIGRAEAGTLPTAGAQGYQTITIPNKYLYSTIKVTGPVIKATRSKAGAFISAVESEIKGATRDMKRAMNRQLHSDGSDALAFWTGADDTSGTNVDDDRGNAFIHAQSGKTYDLIDQSDYATKLGDSIVVTVGAKGATSYAITWTGTVSGSADRDFLVEEDSLGYQMMGIQGVINNADTVIPAGGGTRTGLHGLAAATYPYWNAQVFANSGSNRALTLALMQSPLSEIAVNSDYSESDVKFLLSNVYVRDKYVALLVQEKRFVNTMKLDGGFSGVEFNGIPLVTDPQCRRNRIYYVNPETMKIFRTSDFDWMDEDGAVLVRTSGQDAYEATLFHYGDLGCLCRNANGLLDDITD
jgi:hypothetical protein